MEETEICKHVRMRKRAGHLVMTAGHHLRVSLLQGKTFVTLEIIDDVERWSTDGTILSPEPPAPQSLGEKPQRKDGGRAVFYSTNSFLINVVQIQKKL